jgi:hypothetical protein
MLRFFCKSVSALIVALVVLLQLAPRTFAQTGSWMIVSSPSVPGATLSGVAAVSADDIWAVGNSEDTNFVRSTLAEHWNGSGWSVVSTPNTSAQFGSALSAVTTLATNNVWAVGYSFGSNGDTTLIEQWNGISWTRIASPNPATSDALNSVAAVSAGDIWAVGGQGPNQVDETSLIEHWNGTAWSVVSNPGTSPLSGVTALAPNNVWAVGGTAGSSGSAEILHWNGTQWSVVPSARPIYGDTLRLSAVTAISANDIWAVGIDFYTTGEGDTTNRSLAEHWNGSTWSIAGAPAPVVGGGDQLNGVAALASNDVWAVGVEAGSFIDNFNGSFWQVVPSPQAGNLQAVTTVAGNVWAVGISTNNQPIIEECQGC